MTTQTLERNDAHYTTTDHPRFQEAPQYGIDVRMGTDFIDFIRGDDVVRIAMQHLIYGRDIIRSFDYYFAAVESYVRCGKRVVDYASPRFHAVRGYDLHPVFFASFAEPLSTTDHYLTFADLKPGMTALDLGAYSGLTSILFKQAVGASGTVVAVDADTLNISSIHKNLDLFKRITGLDIPVLEGAVWEHNDGLEFSTEGNMGASAVSIVGDHRGRCHRVASFTLSEIAKRCDLTRVDFIKCDIEGAEAVIFKDTAFFARFQPKIIIEAHYVKGVSTADDCIAHLSVYGYTCTPVPQEGVTLPLIECVPPAA
jgi:FkbM family methyltransferase